MKNETKIISAEDTATKLLQLAGSWKVEMPEERFFINLPVVVGEKLRERPASWWQKGWIYWGTLSGAMTAVMLLFAWQLGTGINADNKLVKTASEWGLDDYGWENVDEVLSQADQSTELSASLKDYGSAILLEYSVSEQEDYQSATENLTDEEWKDVLEQISAKERTI